MELKKWNKFQVTIFKDLGLSNSEIFEVAKVISKYKQYSLQELIDRYYDIKLECIKTIIKGGNSMAKIESIVDDILEKYDEVIDRRGIAEILDIHYNDVPKQAKKQDLPVLGSNNSDYGRIKIHKAVFKEYLVEQYSRKQKSKGDDQ